VRQAIAFIESELRLAIPPLVRRTWPEELVNDTLSEFISSLIEKPPPATVEHPRSYIVRSFCNRCIDVHRAQQRRREIPLEPHHMQAIPAGESPSPEDELHRQARASMVARALAGLPVADRVALKLVDAPEWLTEAEVSWLAARRHTEVQQVHAEIQLARNVHALTLIFDPLQPDQSDDRRQRMERFRRRRARAREKLRELLTGGTES
jgi:DNA-directed RNA polymerase specialized sigma24 family protein